MYELEKARLIKEGLLLVDKLADLDIDVDKDDIEELIENANKLKRNSLWRLK